MNRHQQQYVDALLDGELKGLRRVTVVRHLRVCPLCAAEYRKQRHVRRVLRANPPAVAMSDSPEFFWSKVKAEIERRGAEKVRVPEPRLGLGDWFGQHRWAVAGVVAALVVALGIVGLRQARIPAGGKVAGLPPQFAEVREVTTSVPNTVATVLVPKQSTVTVIWVSGLPWTKDLTEMKTVFAHPYEYLDI